MSLSHEDNHRKIIDHLEFLGYEIEELSNENGFLYVGRNNSKSNLIIKIFGNTTLLTTRYGGFEAKALKSKDFFESLNNINQAAMSKWYYELDTDDNTLTIVTEADYYDYSKTTFGTFVENLEKEITTNLQQLTKFYKEK